MNKKDYIENFNKIKSATKCTDEIAHKALSQTTNLSSAITLARTLMTNESYVGGSSSGLAVEHAKTITEYADGVLVHNTFYSYKDPKNIRFKEMLEKKEFDARLLGGHEDEEMAVRYINKKNETYEKVSKNEQQNDKQKNITPRVEVESLNLPSRMVIEEGDVRFRILTYEQKINVTMKEGTVGDVIKYIEGICNKKVVLKSGNKVLDKEKNIRDVNRTVLMLEIQK